MSGEEQLRCTLLLAGAHRSACLTAAAGTVPESHALASGATGAPLDKHRWAAPWASQYRTLLHRAVKTRRFEALSTRDFIQFVVVGVLAGGPPTFPRAAVRLSTHRKLWRCA